MDLLNRVVCDHKIGDQSFIRERCPRCLGKNFYGGYSIGKDGDIEIVTKVDALNQQILKILTEDRRPSGYGFDHNLLAGVIDASKIAAIKAEIIRCISYLYFLQQSEKKSGFFYAPSEELNKIESVSVAQDESEPRRVFATIVVSTVSGRTVTTSTMLRR